MYFWISPISGSPISNFTIGGNGPIININPTLLTKKLPIRIDFIGPNEVEIEAGPNNRNITPLG